jgi:putative ABC transport system ATP-binding protein
MFQLCGVSKYYRIGTLGEVRAVHDVSLRIERGSFTVITGPSGSGKTTLLALLAALERATHGAIRIDDRDIGELSGVELARLRQRFGFVFQNYALIPNLPIWENVTYPLIPRGVRRAERYELARGLLSRFDIAASMGCRPADLSGGEQQRVALARALAGRPEVFFADEPTSNLDRASRLAFMQVLQEIQSQGTTVVVSCHDMELIALASSAYELENGTLRNTKQPARMN